MHGRQPSWEVRGTTGVEIDPTTGRTLAEHALLWQPSSFRLYHGHLYAFTADGHAYAMK